MPVKPDSKSSQLVERGRLGRKEDIENEGRGGRRELKEEKAGVCSGKL